MTEQPGHLNAPDLVEECARSLSDADVVTDLLYYFPFQKPEEYAVAVHSVLSVLRKRGLLTIQALEMLADK